MEILLFLFLLVGYLMIRGRDKAADIKIKDYTDQQSSRAELWEKRITDQRMLEELQELIMQAAEEEYGPTEYSRGDPVPEKLDRVYSEVSQAYREMGWDVPDPGWYRIFLRGNREGTRDRALDIMMANRGKLTTGWFFVQRNNEPTAIRRRNRCIHDKQFVLWIVNKMREFGIDDPVYFSFDTGNRRPIPLGSEPDEAYGEYRWRPTIWDHEFEWKE